MPWRREALHIWRGYFEIGDAIFLYVRPGSKKKALESKQNQGTESALQSHLTQSNKRFILNL